ncbi:MAG: tetratricopeptide repeat protein [Planctomycetes bacterium]|nr:tetratricopeptide repeat protein [Planctomycetota bacterium]
MAWYLTGRLRQERGQFQKAMEAYQRAAELDPTRPEIYRALVATAVELKQNDKAIQYALKAIELNPNDFLLLRMVGTYLAARPGRLPQAIDLLQRAANSPAVSKRSGFYVTLMRDLATFYLLLRQPEKAADCLEIVFDARIHPEKYDLDARTRNELAKDRASSFQRIGQTFVAAKRYQKAIEAFNRAVQERRGRTGTLSFDLAYAYFQTGNLDKALEHLQTYFDLQLQSKGRSAYELLAQILKKKGQADQLLPKLETLAKKDPQNATLAYFLAEQYVAANRLDDAEKLYQRTLAKSEDAAGYIGLATVYRKRKKPEQLLECLSKVLASEETARSHAAKIEAELRAIAEDAEVLDGLLGIGRKQLQNKTKPLSFAAAYVLGRLAAQAKRTDDVIRFFRFALAQRNPPQRMALLFEQFGEYLLDEKIYDEAAKVFRQAYDDPNLAPLRTYFAVRLSQALEMSEKTDEALRVIAEARKQRDTPQLELQQAWIYYHARRWDNAIKAFEEIVKKYESHEDQRIREIVRRCKLSLSNIYVEKGEIGKGEAILEKVLQENPDDPSVNNDLGYLWADQGKNLDRAEKMIRKALKAEPENAAYLDSMGWVLFKKGKFQEALQFLKKAAENSDRQDAVIWDHLGDCFEKLGQRDAAIDAWKKAIELAKTERHPDKKLIDRVKKKLARSSEGPSKEKTKKTEAAASPP